MTPNRRVGEVRVLRNRESHQLTYCAHCHKPTKRTNYLTSRAYLVGHEDARLPRYCYGERRHKCMERKHSVKAEIVEREFVRLVATLCIKPESLPELAEMFAKSNRQYPSEDRKIDILSEIALCQ